jgi:hypothetical protein
METANGCYVLGILYLNRANRPLIPSFGDAERNLKKEFPPTLQLLTMNRIVGKFFLRITSGGDSILAEFTVPLWNGQRLRNSPLTHHKEAP